MEALGDLLRWWQALSAHSRMAYTIVGVTVIATLAIVIYQGYSGTTTPVPTDTADAKHTPSPMQTSNPLSLPLPGTTRRRQVEAARLLESALAGYDYITAARATFAVGLSETETATSPHLSLQLRLQPTSTLPDNWLDNLITFVLHTVPGIEPADLLIADSHGEVLYAEGQPTSAVASLASTSSPSIISTSKPKTVVGIPSIAWGVAALLSIALATLYLRRARRGSQHTQTSSETAASRPPQLEQFLSGLTAGQIISLAEGERPEVVAALLHHLPDPETAAAARQQMNAPPGNLPEPTRPTRKEILVSFTEALRTKLAASQNTLDNGGDYSE